MLVLSSWRLNRKIHPSFGCDCNLAGKQARVIQWQDIELAACKLELKALEEQLSELIDKRNERIQLLDDFNDLYLVRLGPLMKQILNLRRQLAESTLRKAEAEARRRERDYRNCQQYISQAIDELISLKQRWLALPSISNDTIEIRNRIQQQTELITALLAEIKELKIAFAHGIPSQHAKPVKKQKRNTNVIKNSRPMQNNDLIMIGNSPLSNARISNGCGGKPAGFAIPISWLMRLKKKPIN